MWFHKSFWCTTLLSFDSKVFGAILTNLSKAFDCIYHDLLNAKLHTYGLSLSALKMIQDYLLNQKQRTKIGSSYCTWEKIISGVPRIFLIDLFLEHEGYCFTNCTDDTTPCVVANNTITAQKMEKSLTENFIFCAVNGSSTD